MIATSQDLGPHKVAEEGKSPYFRKSRLQVGSENAQTVFFRRVFVIHFDKAGFLKRQHDVRNVQNVFGWIPPKKNYSNMSPEINGWKMYFLLK